MKDKQVLQHIEDLVDEELKLYRKGTMAAGERAHLHDIQIELDRYWDLLRQRRALRDAGKDPDDASLRDSNTVEGYEQ